MRTIGLSAGVLIAVLAASGHAAGPASTSLRARVTAAAGSAQNPTPTQPPSTPAQLLAMADDVAKEVEALRGWSFKQPVRKQLTTVAEMRQYLEREADRALPAGETLLVQAFLRTIGLIPATTELRPAWLKLLESQVGGFYVPETKTMNLVAREGLPPLIERIMLAHELTHALDDQWVDLRSLTHAGRHTTEDQDLTLESVVEGSATALMMQYAARAMMAGAVDQASLQYVKQEAERSKAFLDAPRYFSAMLGSYICGTEFLARGQLLTLMSAPDDRAIGEALLAARKDPPRSTEQILHPDKYWNAGKRDEPVVIDDAAAAAWLARPGRRIVHADTVGEMLTAILTSRAAVGGGLMALQSAEGWTNTAATGWGGDRFYLLAAGDTADAARASLENVKGVWVTAWDTGKDRDEFLAALPQGSVPRDTVADQVGDAVAIVYFGIDEAERTALTARVRKTPLTMTRNGKTWVGGQ